MESAPGGALEPCSLRSRALPRRSKYVRVFPCQHSVQHGVLGLLDGGLRELNRVVRVGLGPPGVVLCRIGVELCLLGVDALGSWYDRPLVGQLPFDHDVALRDADCLLVPRVKEHCSAVRATEVHNLASEVVSRVHLVNP
jgi:hypothetical protein